MQHQGKAVNKMADTGAAAVQPQQPAAGAQPAAEKAAGGADLRKNLTQLPKHMAETIRKLSRRNKILIVVAVTAALVISILLSVMLNRVKYTALYSGLDASEAGEILSVLQDDKVDAKMSGTSTIMVPEDQADQLRVELAAKGYPKSGLSYDLFTEESKMGATDLETQTRLQYTLQENLRTTIKNMNKIKDCIVIVNLPSNSSYVVSKNTTEASAAVMLELEPGEELSNAEALSIAKFVMKSVPKLTLENISIVDSDMNSYDLSDTGDDTSSTTYSATQMQLAEKMKKILKEQALDILEPALGKGNVAVSVNLALDFDKKTTKNVEFSAPIEGETEGMLRSLQENTDSSTSGSGANGSVGTDSNGVSGTQYVTDNGNGNASNSNSKTYNYELNELQTEIEAAQGKVTDLSVSVLLNSSADGADKATSEAPKLVANAIGVDTKYISVSSLPFVESASGSTFDDIVKANQDTAAAAQRASIIRIAVICGVILLAAIILLVVLRARKRKKEEAAEQAALEAAQAQEAAQEAKQNEDKEENAEQLLDDLVQTKSSETEKVERLVEEYPEAAVQILRNWLTED
jgi:flagellar basal-body M-ring protein/flagellar hook-basal body protein (fliF)